MFGVLTPGSNDRVHAWSEDGVSFSSDEPRCINPSGIHRWSEVGKVGLFTVEQCTRCEHFRRTGPPDASTFLTQWIAKIRKEAYAAGFRHGYHGGYSDHKNEQPRDDTRDVEKDYESWASQFNPP